jgi:hypothetical protein
MSRLRQALVSNPSRVSFFCAGAEKFRPNQKVIITGRYCDRMLVVKKPLTRKCGWQDKAEVEKRSR